MSGIRREIAKAKGILSLREDWDDQGSPPYRLETVRRATSFLERHAKWFSGLFGLALDVPRISPGPDGSIDVHWKTDSYELLVNIPGEGKKPASFYGDDYHQLYIKGTFDPSQVNQGFLQLWLPNRG